MYSISGFADVFVHCTQYTICHLEESDGTRNDVIESITIHPENFELLESRIRGCQKKSSSVDIGNLMISIVFNCQCSHFTENLIIPKKYSRRSSSLGQCTAKK